MRLPWKWALFLLVLLALDVVSKVLAQQSIPPYQGGSFPFGGIALFEGGGITFSLNYATNKGAAWGLFSGYTHWLFALRLAIIFALFRYAPRTWPTGLILTGAIGNVVDYCLYGHVIDFFHFTFWGYSYPIFNFGDSYISLGVIALVLLPRHKATVQ